MQGKFQYLCGEVNVEPPNPKSAKFHGKMGWTIVKHAHVHEPGYVVDFMIKDLKAPPKNVQKLLNKVNAKPLAQTVQEKAEEARCTICKLVFTQEKQLQEHLKSDQHKKMQVIKQKLYASATESQDAQQPSIKATKASL